MHDLVSRRALIGALGAGALLPSLGGAQTYAAAAIPAGSREMWQWLAAQLVLDPRLAWLDTAGFGFDSVSSLADPMFVPGILRYGGMEGLADVAAPFPTRSVVGPDEVLTVLRQGDGRE